MPTTGGPYGLMVLSARTTASVAQYTPEHHPNYRGAFNYFIYLEPCTTLNIELLILLLIGLNPCGSYASMFGTGVMLTGFGPYLHQLNKTYFLVG